MLYIDPLLMARWKHYQTENPAWDLNDLIRQLLTQHFDEADTVRESVIRQTKERSKA